jgi:hypothetical protein
MPNNKMKSPIAKSTYKIKAEYFYYITAPNALRDGYLMSPGADDILSFGTVKEAYGFLTADGGHYAFDYDGDGEFSVGGRYVCAHGQFARPRFTIVNAKSGRCNKAIVAACDKI